MKVTINKTFNNQKVVLLKLEVLILNNLVKNNYHKNKIGKKQKITHLGNITYCKTKNSRKKNNHEVCSPLKNLSLWGIINKSFNNPKVALKQLNYLLILKLINKS